MDGIRSVFLGIAVLATVLFGLCEVVLAYPVAGWLYLPVGFLFVLALARRMPAHVRTVRIAMLVSPLVVLGTLYGVEWTSRKPFLRDFRRVQTGMTASEVRVVMKRHIKGTGWPLPDFDRKSPEELKIPDSLVFRHSNFPRFNSDWGIVRFSKGRVVDVDFSAD